MRTRRLKVALVAVLGLVMAPVLGWSAYAAVTWLSFGPKQSSQDSDAVMDRYMPRYDIAEVHRVNTAAPASTTYDVARALDLHQSRVINAIFRSREVMLRATPDAPPSHQPLVTELLSIGWGVLEEVPGRRIVFGAVTQPWKANVVFRALPPATFASFDSAGYVKIVVTLAADSLGPRESAFRTETRVLATDPESRAKFRRYWSIFSPGILLIRTQSLEIVRRDAERLARTPVD
jgi:hypothetical protein